jgi:hypothetical protein
VPEKKKSLPLSVTHPDLAKEADGWDPSLVTHASHKLLNWICSEGHSFQIAVIKRTQRGNGCQVCSGRKVLEGVNDLATSHPEIAREAFNWDPAEFVAGSKAIKEWVCRFGHHFQASIGNRSGQNKSGCPICSGHKVLIGFNDLATINPSIASQAFGWDPSSVTAGATQKREWKCAFGHIFSAAPKDRANPSLGCPYCSNQKVLQGFNDLLTTHPILSKEADGWNPQTVVAGSGLKKNWKCSEGHKYQASIVQRTTGGSDSRGTGCPICASTGFNPGKQGFLYLLFQSSWGMYQIGITNHPERRMQEHARNRWEIIEIRGPMDGHLTQQWETAILRMLKAKGADLSNEKIAGKFDGYSEAWSKSTFEVSSIKEMMKLTEEYEEEK